MPLNVIKADIIKPISGNSKSFLVIQSSVLTTIWSISKAIGASLTAMSAIFGNNSDIVLLMSAITPTILSICFVSPSAVFPTARAIAASGLLMPTKSVINP